MKKYFSGYRKYTFGLLAFILIFSLVLGIGERVSLRPGEVEAKISPETIVFDKAHPQIRDVIAIQNLHTPDLMALPQVVGTATGLGEDGRPAILVFAKNRVEAGVVPQLLDGVPVVVKVTGEIVAMPKPENPPGKPGGGTTIDSTKGFPRPVPIGVSTGNQGECSAGTIGARVKDVQGNVFVLSNNHVCALENNALIGSQVLQPGLYDTTNCVLSQDDVIGTLSAFEPIVFSQGSSNLIDAALALSSIEYLDNVTPSNGYGIPRSTVVEESLGELVQKYGRTTSLTKGEITGINATVNVGYDSGTALFVGQIVVSGGKGPFIKPGDSGSLLVTDPGRDPVGLLFAGSVSGKIAIANPIGAVLEAFGVTIDGE